MLDESTQRKKIRTHRHHALAIGWLALLGLTVCLVPPVLAVPVPEVGEPEQMLVARIETGSSRPTDPGVTCHVVAPARLHLEGRCAEAVRETDIKFFLNNNPLRVTLTRLEGTVFLAPLAKEYVFDLFGSELARVEGATEGTNILSVQVSCPDPRFAVIEEVQYELTKADFEAARAVEKQAEVPPSEPVIETFAVSLADLAKGPPPDGATKRGPSDETSVTESSPSGAALTTGCPLPIRFIVPYFYRGNLHQAYARDQAYNLGLLWAWFAREAFQRLNTILSAFGRLVFSPSYDVITIGWSYSPGGQNGFTPSLCSGPFCQAKPIDVVSMFNLVTSAQVPDSILPVLVVADLGLGNMIGAGFFHGFVAVDSDGKIEDFSAANKRAVVFAHELAHIFGLSHTEESNNLMRDNPDYVSATNYILTEEQAAVLQARKCSYETYSWKKLYSFTYRNPHASPAADCGDNLFEPGEECERGNLLAGFCPYFPDRPVMNELSIDRLCSTDCKCVTPTPTPTPTSTATPTSTPTIPPTPTPTSTIPPTPTPTPTITPTPTATPTITPTPTPTKTPPGVTCGTFIPSNEEHQCNWLAWCPEGQECRSAQGPDSLWGCYCVRR